MLVPWFDVDAAVAEMNAMSRQIDALLGHRGLDGRHGLRSLDPRVELGLREEDDAWVLSADLPGVSPQDVNVTYEDGTLTVRAERRWTSPEDAEVRYAERGSYALNRTTRVPDRVDADGISASFAHGVLTVRLPKRAQARPRTIPVEAA